MNKHPFYISLGSLFDGIGGFPYAASFYGIKSLWASEIMPQAISVTMRHFPDMKHVGDITAIDGAKLPPVNIITFGSPCQGLSVAGRRRGLADERSGLFAEAVRIIDEMRKASDGKYPNYAVWENVPGAMSSAGGCDFAAVLTAFAKTEIPIPLSGRWANAGMVRGVGVTIAWRVLNACLWGVPQRRRRIFLVASFGTGRAGEVLFVEKGLRGDPAAGAEARQRTAADAPRSAGGAMPGGVIPFASNQRDEVRSLGVASGALVASPGMKQQTFIAEKCLTPWDVQSRRVHPENSQWPALYGAEGGGHGYAAKCLNPWDTQQSRIFIENGASPALTGADGGGGRNPGGLVAAFCGGASAQARSIGYSEDVSPTLKAEAGGFAAPCICEPEIARTLTARGDSSPCADRGQNVIAALRADVAAPCNEPHPNITGTLCASGAGLSRPAGMASEPDLCVAYALQGNMIGRREHNGPSGSGVSENLSFTLTAADTPGIAAALPISIQDKATRHNGPSRNEGGAGNGLGVGEPGDPVHTMTVGDQHAALVYDRQRSDLFRKRDVASTQAARQHKDATDLVFETGERSDQEGNRYIVRRLTPAECESLQGYMAGYTAFGCGGEKISDSRRYQMLGNSLAIPCAKFVLGNIAAQMRGG